MSTKGKCAVIGRPSLIELACLVVGVVLTVRYAWLLDDAYVYFRYAENALIRGDGLVYNRGEYVEGFSSPLWVLLVTALRVTTANYWVLVIGIGVSCFVAFWFSLVATNRRLSPAGAAAINVPLIYLSTNYGVMSYFTSGTESPLVLVLAASFACFILCPGRAGLQAAIALAPLVRHELVLPCLAGAAWAWWHERKPPWVLMTTGTVLGGAWLAFRIYYYADIFPVTYYLKNVADVGQGLRYVHDTMAPYHLHAFIVVAVGLLSVAARLTPRPSLFVGYRFVMLGSAVLMAAYVVKIGGDARHLRYLAFPFTLVACALGGIVELVIGAIPKRARHLSGVVVAMLVAIVSLSSYPRQLGGNPLRAVRQPAVQVDKIADAATHRNAWWGTGNLFAADARPAPSARVRPEYENLSVSFLCWALFEHIDRRAVHTLGLVEPVLARTEMSWERPGHKMGLRALGYDIARIIRWYDAPPEPGMYRAAMRAGVAPRWVAENIDAIEIIERKTFNRHDFGENARLALAFPRVVIAGRGAAPK